MNQLAIVYWSGTGNTQIMSDCIAQGAIEAGALVEQFGPAEFSPHRLSQFQVIAFGCPAMGAEVLEEMEFEPMFAQLEPTLSGKKIALFGSYGWGDGQWMRDWCARCLDDNAILYDEMGLMVNEAPDDNAKEACRALGRALAAW